MDGQRLPERFEDGDLVLRRWLVEGAAAMHAAVVSSVEHLRPWMPWIAFEPRTVEQRAELIAEWEQTWLGGGDLPLVALLDGVVVGSSGLHRRIGPDGLEIGYWIHIDHAGRGLATRVARLATTGAFTVPGITHVEIHCDGANHRSARIPQKLGFTYTGDVPRPVEAPAETGAHRVYRMRRGDWMVE